MGHYQYLIMKELLFLMKTQAVQKELVLLLYGIVKLPVIFKIIKMKNLIYISILIGFFIACSHENENENAQFGQHLKIDEVKNYLPESYFQETALIYVNSAGMEKELHITAKEITVQRTHDNDNYTTDQFEITIFDPDNLSFQISLVGSTNRFSDNIVATGLTGWLMPFHESGHTRIRVQFENNLPKVDIFNNFNETIFIIDKEFSDVYIAIGKNNLQEEYEVYSELNINSEYGVVAFKDENNELWRFDRFK